MQYFVIKTLWFSISSAVSLSTVRIYDLLVHLAKHKSVGLFWIQGYPST